MNEDHAVSIRSRLMPTIALLALLPFMAAAQETTPVPAETGQAETQVGESEPATTATETIVPAEGIDSANEAATPGSDATAEENEAAGDDATPLDPLDDSAPAGEVRQAGLPHDLSPWGMFMAADIVVKAVMVGLAFASVVTWTVLLAKMVELGAAQRAVRRAVRQLTAARGLTDAEKTLGSGRSVSARMTQAAREEMTASEAALDHVSDSGVKERVASRLSRIEVNAGRQITKGTGILATIGSTAPFVGLFGTVWGIMNSFIGISKAQTTNLAIVAPGIAEALLATAIGLVAAIPAVVFYNFLARAITGYRQALSDASAAIERLVSRDLDMRRAYRHAARTGEQPALKADPAYARIG
jgi:biopolymer transport protein ExbB